ncbi:MAG: glycosyl hydrolase 53 family protein, partial [Prevotella sp.]|nr:glycosyl hydrolase 53 family protein [Prevotella sp.]
IDSPDANWNRFFSFLKKAGAACREECPDAKIIIHSERVPEKNVLIDYFDRIKTASIDYDIIGLSYYPAYHRDLATLEGALKALEDKNYGKDIMIVETGYSYAWALDGTTFDYTATYPYTEEGQRQFTADLITMLNKHESVKGLFWWWPEDNGNKGVTDKWWNAAIYNHDTGKPYAAFYELKNFLPNGDANDDGKVNVTDIVAVVNFIMGTIPEVFNKNAADMNNDGYINVTDIVKIVNFIMEA